MTNSNKIWKLRCSDTKKSEQFFKKTGDKLISHLLSQRNILLNDADRFLNSNYKDLSHPHNLSGIKEASEIFCKHALNNEEIAIIGDFDADGLIASSMLKLLCDNFEIKSTVFIPSRCEHGYGLTHKFIQEFKSKIKKPPELLMITDCGSSSENYVKELKEFGIKHIIIIDHHIIEKENVSKSADVLINWHNCNYNEMCSCGEVYQFIRGIRWLTKKIDPTEYLLYAAVGTIGDVSPIVGDNRILVKNGLNNLNNSICTGMLALFESSGINSVYGVSQEDIKFKIVPRINAAGRMGKPDAAFNLLVEHDFVKASKISQYLTEQNIRRKELQAKIEIEAHEAAKKLNCKYGILLINPEWDVGIVGIIASYLVKEFKLPSIVMGEMNGIIKGSGRSISGIDLKKILDSCNEMFSSYGGHSMAAGITLKSEFVNNAHVKFEEACKNYYEKEGYPEQHNFYDAELKISSVTFDNAKKINMFYPYCDENNPEPIFKVSNATIVDPEIWGNDKWKLLSFSILKDGQNTPFRFKMFTKKYGTEISNCDADIYFTFPQILHNTNNKLQVIDLQLK